MSRLITATLLVFFITACSGQAAPAMVATSDAPTEIPRASPLVATGVPSPPTEIPRASPLTAAQSNWAGGITYTDGTVEPILVHLDASGGTLIIQPKTDVLTLDKVERHENTVSFSLATPRPLQFTGQLTSL